MRKIIYSVLIIGLLTTGVFAKDTIIAPSTLPQQIQTFIQQNFKGVEITYAEKDFREYEVNLADGTKMDFSSNGEWKEIKSHGNPIPASVLPAVVAQAVQKAQPKGTIMEVEKEWSGYEVVMNNNMKLYIDNKGALVGQKMDH